MQGRDQGVWSFRKREVGSTSSLDGLARTLPNAPPPLSLQRSSGLSRVWQLYSLQKFLDIPVTPSYVANDGGVVRTCLIHTGLIRSSRCLSLLCLALVSPQFERVLCEYCDTQVFDRVMATVNVLGGWASATMRVRAQSIWSQRSNEEVRAHGWGQGRLSLIASA
jgi:hypothetical protein